MIKYKSDKLIFTYILVYCIFQFFYRLRFNLEFKFDLSDMLYNIENNLLINFSVGKTILFMYNYGFIGFRYIVGNLCLFLPLGILININYKNSRKKIFLVFILLIFFIIKEIIQFCFFNGSLDIDTIILHFIGLNLGLICGYIWNNFIELLKR